MDYNGLFSGQMMDYFVDYHANLKVVCSNNPWWWLASRVGQVVPRWISWTYPFWCLCGEGKNAWPSRALQQFSKTEATERLPNGWPTLQWTGAHKLQFLVANMSNIPKICTGDTYYCTYMKYYNISQSQLTWSSQCKWNCLCTHGK